MDELPRTLAQEIDDLRIEKAFGRMFLSLTQPLKGFNSGWTSERCGSIAHLICDAAGCRTGMSASLCLAKASAHSRRWVGCLFTDGERCEAGFVRDNRSWLTETVSYSAISRLEFLSKFHASQPLMKSSYVRFPTLPFCDLLYSCGE